MQKTIYMLKNRMLPILGVVVFLGFLTSASIAAAQKVLGAFGSSTNSSKSQNFQSVKNSETTKDTKKVLTETAIKQGSGSNDDEIKNIPADKENFTLVASASNTNQNTQTTLAVKSNSTGSVFTLAELATHNKSGDCYVAYKGTVYNVSNVAVWAGCQHHGAVGGTDVTALFPHPTTYFNTIPVVGALATTNGTGQNNTNNQGQNSTVGSGEKESKWENESEDHDRGSDEGSEDRDDD